VKKRRVDFDPLDAEGVEKECPVCFETKPLIGGWHTKIKNGSRVNKFSICLECRKEKRERNGPKYGIVELDQHDRSLVCLQCPLESCTEDKHDSEEGICNLKPAQRMARL